MALRTIRVQGDPVLEKICKPVKELTPRTKELIEDMLDTMYEANGVGLAAPQVGILKRIVVIDVGEGPVGMVNPGILETSGEQTGDEGYLKDHLNDKDKVDAKSVAARLKVLKKADPKGEEYAALKQFVDLTDSLSKQNKAVREMNAELEEKVRAKYALLTDEEILDLLVNRKWYATIFEGIKALYVTTSHQMTNRVVELVERYEDTLPELTAAVADYESKVKAHLKRMGFVW